MRWASWLLGCGRSRADRAPHASLGGRSPTPGAERLIRPSPPSCTVIRIRATCCRSGSRGPARNRASSSSTPTGSSRRGRTTSGWWCATGARSCRSAMRGRRPGATARGRPHRPVRRRKRCGSGGSSSGSRRGCTPARSGWPTSASRSSPRPSGSPRTGHGRRSRRAGTPDSPWRNARLTVAERPTHRGGTPDSPWRNARLTVAERPTHRSGRV